CRRRGQRSRPASGVAPGPVRSSCDPESGRGSPRGTHPGRAARRARSSPRRERPPAGMRGECSPGRSHSRRDGRSPPWPCGVPRRGPGPRSTAAAVDTLGTPTDARTVQAPPSGGRIVRMETAERLLDAVTSFLHGEGGTALVPGVREAARPSSSPERVTVEAHVPEARAGVLTSALAGWLDSLAQVEPAAADVRVTTATLPELDWIAVFRHHHRPIAVGER